MDPISHVTAFCRRHDILIIARLDEWHPFTGAFSHPLFGHTEYGITDGVVGFATFPRGVFHISMGQLEAVPKPERSVAPEKSSSSRRKSNLRVSLDTLY